MAGLTFIRELGRKFIIQGIRRSHLNQKYMWTQLNRLIMGQSDSISIRKLSRMPMICGQRQDPSLPLMRRNIHVRSMVFIVFKFCRVRWNPCVIRTNRRRPTISCPIQRFKQSSHIGRVKYFRRSEIGSSIVARSANGKWFEVRRAIVRPICFRMNTRIIRECRRSRRSRRSTDILVNTKFLALQKMWPAKSVNSFSRCQISRREISHVSTKAPENS